MRTIKVLMQEKNRNPLNSSITWLQKQGRKGLIENLNEVMKSQFTDKDDFEPRDNSKIGSFVWSFRTINVSKQGSNLKTVKSIGPLENGKMHQDPDG